MEKFSYEENGYNKAEVNKFIDDVITQTESILSRLKRQRNEIANLTKELEVYRNLEKSLNASLLRAEETSSSIKKNAIDEAKLIVNEAKNNASRIVNDALIRADKIEIKADTLERNIIVFKRRLKLIVDQQQSVIEDIEELDLK